MAKHSVKYVNKNVKHLKIQSPTQLLFISGLISLTVISSVANNEIKYADASSAPAHFFENITNNVPMLNNSSDNDSSVSLASLVIPDDENNAVSRDYDRAPIIKSYDNKKETTTTNSNGVLAAQTVVDKNVNWGGIEHLNIVPTKTSDQIHATEELMKMVDNANNIYSQSANIVNDNSTRDNLKTLIDKANSIKDDVNQSVDDLNNLKKNIDDSVNKVEDSNRIYNIKMANIRRQMALQSYNEWLKNHPSSGIGEKIVAYAAQFIGKVPYVWGGASETNGMDCSGLVMMTFRHFGVNLPHFSGSQVRYGKQIPSLNEAKPGDIIGNNTHVGILSHRDANGNWWVVNAASPSEGIKYSPVVWAFNGSYTISRLLN